MPRVLEWIFFLYFVVHIPIGILFDSQAVYPGWMYPTFVKDAVSWYGKTMKDPMMLEPPAWYQAFCMCEQFLQLPFFFAAAYAFYKGNCGWVRMPAIIYSAHVVTTLVAILYHIAMHDFSQSKYPGPSTMMERLTLISIYLPFFVIPLLLLIVMVADEGYGSHASIKGPLQPEPRRSLRLKKK
ncbi:sigma intracellular receptor 2 isoform X1 [Lingula anatina]|uniref:Sigma intracellular receptor 2 n=1 Tax=Lingula anatina TaxID=7574 RepID=A0A1S3K234_LINAN|nr:sigma intracellular receptor 2 isoform X1 [Lingula anatina]|eukprot:XP_013416577.1 sigma intracellular receptor 2 isoform X1 [Lingula anatina]